MAERPGLQRSLLLYNWKPSGSWASIANGSADAQIATVAASIKEYPHKIFLNIWHEPEDNVSTSASSGMTARDYANMFRHVVTELRAAGVDNVVFVWNVMGYYGWRQYLDDLYPGNDYVDWVCFDPYIKDNIQDHLGELMGRPRPDIGWPGFYHWATAKAPGKPIMMCEWGVDVTSTSDPAAMLDYDIDKMAADYPMLKAWVYWNEHGVGNYRIDQTSAKGQAYGAAFRRLAAHPQFNAMTPDSAP
jgi:beta-mannanase